MEALTQVVKYLDAGFLGLAVVVLAIVVRTLYKRNQDLSDERETLHKEYQTKLETVTDRELKAAWNYADKNRELAKSTQSVLDALLKRGQDG